MLFLPTQKINNVNKFIRLSFLLIIAGLMLTGISGCSKNNSFLSSKKLKSKIEGEWYLVKLFVGPLGEDWDENWTFAPDGSLTIFNVTKNRIDYTGSYTVGARLFNSKLNIQGTSREMYNGKWLIVTIDNKRLQLNIDYKDCAGKHCGSLQREFIRN